MSKIKDRKATGCAEHVSRRAYLLSRFGISGFQEVFFPVAFYTLSYSVHLMYLLILHRFAEVGRWFCKLRGNDLQLAPLGMIGEPPNVDFKAAEICGLSAYLNIFRE